MHRMMLGMLAVIAVVLLGAGAMQLLGVDPEAGRLLAVNNCSTCHDLTEQRQHRRGPYMWGVVGRQAASLDYAYSNAFLERVKDQPFAWDMVHLEAFITDPEAFMAGTRMAKKPSKHSQSFSGIADATNRRNLIAFLKTLK